MFQIGDLVRLLAPFDVVYPGEFTVEGVRTLPDGHTAVTIFGADFDPIFLEKV